MASSKAMGLHIYEWGRFQLQHTSESSSFLEHGSKLIDSWSYILTLPAEWRFYRSQRSWRISVGCILFILLRSDLNPSEWVQALTFVLLNRYISIATLTVSNVGYFGTFSSTECGRYYIVAPVLKGQGASFPQTFRFAKATHSLSNNDLSGDLGTQVRIRWKMLGTGSGNFYCPGHIIFPVGHAGWSGHYWFFFLLSRLCVWATTIKSNPDQNFRVRWKDLRTYSIAVVGSIFRSTSLN